MCQEGLRADAVVLDPMCGSGMVPGMAARRGMRSIGCDIDTLARLISGVNSKPVDPDAARAALGDLMKAAAATPPDRADLPWIDGCGETRKRLEFWFAPMQRDQLRRLFHQLVTKPLLAIDACSDVLKVAVSRLIVTKTPKASLAADTARSRPHRVLTENTFDVKQALPGSLDHVLRVIGSPDIPHPAEILAEDARDMAGVPDGAVDLIITSPPYLNAINYMRGHRLSLHWMGYTASDCRKMAGRCVGATAKACSTGGAGPLDETLDRLPLGDRR